MGVKTIEVTVKGFPPVLVSHRTPSKAFARAWEQYCSYDDGCSFGKFMQIARRKTVDNPPGVGEAVTVLGRSAWTVEPRQHTTKFIYCDGGPIMSAHHSEIVPGHDSEGRPVMADDTQKLLAWAYRKISRDTAIIGEDGDVFYPSSTCEFRDAVERVLPDAALLRLDLPDHADQIS